MSEGNLAMTPLDEQALRRPGFQEGVPIQLEDGQLWTFPRPVMVGASRFVNVRPDGSVAVVGIPEFEPGQFGPDYLAKVEALFSASYQDEEQPAMAALAVDLLLRNYDLKGKDFRQLLRFHEGVELYGPYWQPIIDVAVGNAPKPSPIG
jgi:hypothetical protein